MSGIICTPHVFYTIFKRLFFFITDILTVYVTDPENLDCYSESLPDSLIYRYFFLYQKHPTMPIIRVVIYACKCMYKLYESVNSQPKQNSQIDISYKQLP